MRFLAIATLLLTSILCQCLGICPPAANSVNLSPAPSPSSWTPSASNWQCPSPPAATFVGSYNPATGWAGICTLASGIGRSDGLRRHVYRRNRGIAECGLVELAGSAVYNRKLYYYDRDSPRMRFREKAFSDRE
jgi:hypothetical protein